MIFSASCFALMTIIVKFLDDIGTFPLVFARSIGTTAICIAILKFQRVPLLGNYPAWLTIRGIVGCISLIFFFYAIKLMPLASAVSLRYLSPFFAMVLAMYLLHENILKRQWIYMLIAFAGAVLIKGFDFRISLFAFVVILISAFFSGMVYFVIRRIGTSEHPIVIILYFAGISSIVSLIGSLFQNNYPIGVQDILPLISIGVLGFGGQFFMTKAFQIEEANKVAPLKYIEAVFAFILAWVWFGEQQSLLSLCGMAMIILGVILNSMKRKRKSSQA